MMELTLFEDQPDNRRFIEPFYTRAERQRRIQTSFASSDASAAQLNRMSRTENPQTSHDAAAKALPKVGTHKAIVLQAFKDRGDFGFTDEELIEYCDLKNDAARKRRVDLYNDGLVIKTDMKRITTSKCEAHVFKLAESQNND
jgi:hypothetical protein